MSAGRVEATLRITFRDHGEKTGWIEAETPRIAAHFIECEATRPAEEEGVFPALRHHRTTELLDPLDRIKHRRGSPGSQAEVEQCCQRIDDRCQVSMVAFGLSACLHQHATVVVAATLGVDIGTIDRHTGDEGSERITQDASSKVAQQRAVLGSGT